MTTPDGKRNPAKTDRGTRTRRGWRTLMPAGAQLPRGLADARHRNAVAARCALPSQDVAVPGCRLPARLEGADHVDQHAKGRQKFAPMILRGPRPSVVGAVSLPATAPQAAWCR